MGNPELGGEMLDCAINVAEAAVSTRSTIDIFITYLADADDSTIKTILRQFEGISGVRTVRAWETPNRGADVGQFLSQLDRMVEVGANYDVILKMHTKTDPIWRERATESLCGTKEQVQSAWKIFSEETNVDMLSPLGTTFGPSTEVSNIFPRIVKKYNWDDINSEGPRSAFDSQTVSKMNELYKLMQPAQGKATGTDTFAAEDLTIVAGTMFWVRVSALGVDALAEAKYWLDERMTKGYRDNGGAEHILERVIPSRIKAKGSLIKELPPAPKVIAIYFPQYHRVKENDLFWGEGFTEWTLLKPIKEPYALKPLALEDGGLGYYDLMDADGASRKRQGQLANAAGVYGFSIYHYWFSGQKAPKDHKVMHKVVEAMLKDNKPNVKFMLSWANEPWSRRWTGGANVSPDDVLLLSQEYGDETEWIEHFNYLLQFFSHPRYIKIRGMPVFVIYRAGHFGTSLVPMLRKWRELAIDAGFPGLHIINTLGNFYNNDKETKNLLKEADIDASFHFWPLLKGGGFVPQSRTASTENFDIPTNQQYWGAFTGFDRRPRSPDNKYPLIRSVEEFRDGLACSFSQMSQDVTRIGTNLFFVTAWNEWNEQAVLEPSQKFGFGYLKALHEEINAVPARTPGDSFEEPLFLPKCAA